MAPSYLGLCLLILATTTVDSYHRDCLHPDTHVLCSGEGSCSAAYCECFSGYEGQWCETCTDCDKCGEIGGCLECLLYDSGPAKHAGECGNCTHFTNVFLIEDIKKDQFDPRKSPKAINGSCQIVDDSGCDISFWYGYEEENDWYGNDWTKLQVWTDNKSRVCPPSEEIVVAEECRKKETCMECERSPGCGWCSSSGQDIKTRCNSIKENQKICASSSTERKFTGGPTTVVEARVKKYEYDRIQLRPQGVELVMNVGDIKYLDFTYFFFFALTNISHNFPENIELEIFSTCGGKFNLRKVTGCTDILNGHTVQFHARFRLKSCPAISAEWDKSYKLTFTHGDALDIDFKAFCSCSCDKFTTEAICRNDKKTFMEVNPCAKKDTCTDCLKDSACNWCSASKYSYFDGSPLPRCNNDNFFTSTICPAGGRVDPVTALTGSEDCSNCKHSCSGGICSEKKEDLISLNTCVSQLTCGDCMQAEGCAWCLATDGAHTCNMVSNWVGGTEEGQTSGKVECQGKLYGDPSKMSHDKLQFFGNGSCDCGDQCLTGYEKLHSSCQGGTLKCGVCQECPDGSFGEFCQCNQDGTDRQLSPPKALPAIVIGNKDDLVGKSTKVLKDQISFAHVIAPIDVPAYTLKCNATYCINTNSRECYILDKSDSKFDLARAANLFAIYGDHRLLPGAELIFRITYCPLTRDWREKKHETRFGFGTPPSKNNDYNLPQKYSYEMLQFWSDDMLLWEVDDFDEFHDDTLQSMKYGYAAWFDDRTNWKGEKQAEFERREPVGIWMDEDDYTGYVKQKIDSDVKLVVTETEVIWSWEGFKSDRHPEMTELRQKINMKEKEYFPLFLIPGCETDGEFSSVKIISSKVGKA